MCGCAPYGQALTLPRVSSCDAVELATLSSSGNNESQARRRLDSPTRSIMKLMALCTVGLLVAYIGACGLLYAIQNRLLYLPTVEWKTLQVKALRIPCDQAVLKVWQLHGDAGPALIYFGGNAEDVAANLADFDAAFPDRTLYLVNYRGYGGSTGSPSESALIADAQVVYDFIRPQHDRIAVMGRSLGSGVATALANARVVERLVLVTPYDSIVNVAGDHFRWIPVRWLLRDRYDSAQRIRSIRAPVLVLIAENDEVVFRARSDALVAAIPAALRHTVVIPRATHNDISSFDEYLPAVHGFLAGH